MIPLNAFVRIKVVGLEKNRRDVYVKFSAEVHLLRLTYSMKLCGGKGLTIKMGG